MRKMVGTGIDRAPYGDSRSVDRRICNPRAGNTGVAAGYTYTAVEDLYGCNFNANLCGNAGANAIWGVPGDDTISGRAGNDMLVVPELTNPPPMALAASTSWTDPA
jgi:hypothetical protein